MKKLLLLIAFTLTLTSCSSNSAEELYPRTMTVTELSTEANTQERPIAYV